MKIIFHTLKKDHTYFKQMLDQLDKQAARLQTGGIPDWSMVDHIVNTLRHYPEQSHHDMEDDFLELLKSRHWISDMVIESLHRDHERLERLGAQVQAQLSPVGRPANADQLKRALDVITTFVSAYKNHIRTEEEIVFPMVEKLIEEQNELHTALNSKNTGTGVTIIH